MYDYLFKFVVIGNTGTGKSCLMQRYTEDKFNIVHDMTIGVEFGVNTENINDTIVKTQIWDTAGQEVFDAVTKNYYRNAAGVLLCYDPTNKTSFYDLTKKWIKDIENYCPKNISVILVANKSDLMDKTYKIPTKMGEELAKKHGFLFIETSSKMNVNVKAAFVTLIEKILKDIKDGTFTLEDYNGGVRLPEPYKLPTVRKSKCC